MTEVALSYGALVIVLPALPTALVDAAVFSVFDMPFVPKIQLAQQGLQHDTSLILDGILFVISIMALTCPAEQSVRACPMDGSTAPRAKKSG